SLSYVVCGIRARLDETRASLESLERQESATEARPRLRRPAVLEASCLSLTGSSGGIMRRFGLLLHDCRKATLCPPYLVLGLRARTRPHHSIGEGQCVEGSTRAENRECCLVRRSIAVGIPVTRYPLHRSGREGLPHPAPTLGA